METTLADFSKDKFPYNKYFEMDGTAFYPKDFLKDGSLEGTFAEYVDEDLTEIDAGVAEIDVKDLKNWTEVAKDDIPDDLLDAMM
jgi:hypothetical protein